MAEITGRKQLIHLHGSVASALTADKLNKGELAVIHNQLDASDKTHAVLATLRDDNNLAYFVDSGTVATMIEQGAGTGLTALSAATVALEGRVETNETKIKTLEDTVGTAIDGYGTLCNEVERLSLSATSANTRLATAESDIDNLESSRLKNVVVNGVSGTVANNIATVTIDANNIQYSDAKTVKAKIDDLDSAITSDEAAISQLQTRATNLEALHAAGSHNGKSTVAEEVTAGINTLNAAEAGGAGKYIKSISESNGIITTTTGSTSEFDAVGSADAAKTAAIAAAAASAATLEGEISGIDSRLRTAETDIDDLQGLVGTSAVTTQIQNAINALDAAVSSSTVTAGQGIQVAVKEVDGIITQVAVSGNYDAKYDAIGSASAACMSAATYADGLNTAMDTRVQKVETNLNGFAANENVKTYVDDEIAAAVSSALRFKGSKTFAEAMAITGAGLTNGYVYNITTSGTIEASKSIDGKTIPVKPGDNIVVIENPTGTFKWDKLAADIDLSTYATVEYVNTLSGNTYNAITGETKARQDADAALEALITSVQGSGITSISVDNTDGDYVTLSVDGSGNTRTIYIADTVQAVASASSSAKGLAEASDVKTYVDTAIGNESARTDTAINTAKTELVNGETSYDTFKKAGDAIRTNATNITNLSNAAIKGVSAGTLSNISMTVTAKDANGLVKINATATTGSLTTATTATTTLATVGDVKKYVDTAIGNESARTDTAIGNAKTELIGDMTGETKTLGGLEDRIDNHDTAITALQNGRLTDVAVVDNTSATGVQKINVTSTTTGTVDSLNFTNIVIDCGTFD